jgi:hypothetical protein
MSDRELLELTAKAAGIKFDGIANECGLFAEIYENNCWGVWNPLTDDGDALRLAVKLSIPFHVFYESGSVIAYGKKSKHHPEGLDIQELFTSDPCAATRRAITRAAAEMEMSKCKDN